MDIFKALNDLVHLDLKMLFISFTGYWLLIYSFFLELVSLI